jgi:hypothetical protein
MTTTTMKMMMTRNNTAPFDECVTLIDLLSLLACLTASPTKAPMFCTVMYVLSRRTSCIRIFSGLHMLNRLDAENYRAH